MAKSLRTEALFFSLNDGGLALRRLMQRRAHREKARTRLLRPPVRAPGFTGFELPAPPHATISSEATVGGHIAWTTVAYAP